MRIVVTRPPHSGERTAARLLAMGHEPVLLPLFEPVHYPGTARQALLAGAGGLIVTSAEALRVLDGLEAEKTAYLDRPLFAVGAATAAEARRRGFTRILTAEKDGAALAALIAETWWENGALLYLAGQPRGTALEDGLAEAGIAFRSATIYEMRKLEWNERAFETKLLAAPPDAVLLYSAEAARAFFAQLGPYAQQLPGCAFLCISGKVAALVPRPFRSRAIAAARADEQAMLDLLSLLPAR